MIDNVSLLTDFLDSQDFKISIYALVRDRGLDVNGKADFFQRGES